MRKTINLCTLLLFFFIANITYATIINVPGDYPTIQAGINTAINGDTVLVQPETYVENINFNGKNITVASLFYTTHDTSYISQTIIDGNQNGSVVTFENGEDSTVVLTGFTLTNGQGGGSYPDNTGGGITCKNSSFPSLENLTITGNSAVDDGGGICCRNNSSPSLENVTITGNSSNYGGGIYCSHSSPSLTNVTITGNSAGSKGGGIYCNNSSLSFENITITGNSAISSGGGIYLYHYHNASFVNVTIAGNSADEGGGISLGSSSNLTLENVTITSNSADLIGGGIYCEIDCSLSLNNVTITGNSASSGGGIYCLPNSNPVFNFENRCNIYLNNITNSRGYGADIFAVGCDTINVIVDTFTVLTPTDYYASPIDKFTFDILHSIQDSLINADLYVSVDGDDTNSGTSPDEPLKTIRCALYKIYTDSLNHNTIHLLPGVYSPSTNGENFPIEWSNYVSLEGISEEDTILDADSLSGVLRFHYVTESNIKNISIKNGNDTEYGGGIFCYNSSPSLENVTITGNSAVNWGGGIYCYYSSPILTNVTISGNTAGREGGGICCYYYNLSLTNVIISGNTAGHEGGGIYCGSSSPFLLNVTINDNSARTGGGIFCSNSNLSLVNVTITGNSATGYYGCVGGGIYCGSSSPTFENVTITGNIAWDRGGGIFCHTSSPSLENVTITGNSASEYGGGIYCNYNSNLIFDNENRCNLYLNNTTNSKGYGVDIFARNCDIINIIVDTFTVLTPTDYYTSPIDKFTFDILHSIQDSLINSDLYVSVDGDNTNSGTSPAEPLKTIKCALSRIYTDSLNHNIIHLLPGVYSPSTNGENFPIEWSNYVSLEGISEKETILDADSLSGVLRFTHVADAVIMNITIRNGYASDTGGGIYCGSSSPTLENVTITGNYASYWGGGISCFESNPSLVNVAITGNSVGSKGGGIYCNNSSPSFTNFTISGNTALYGGGINCYNSSPSLENVTITGNSANWSGGGIRCYNSSPSLENVTITGNSANTGGGVYCIDNSNPYLVNSILWNNTPQEVYFDPDWLDPNTITISYSDIQGDSAGIVTNNNGTVYWLNGNIDEDPLFVDPENGDYHLSWANFPIPDSTKSPCIDAGNPDPQYNDPDGTRNDMGAYYFNQTVGVDDNQDNMIESEIVKNYPNPFNNITSISYALQHPSFVKLQIYNIKGQLVGTLINEHKPAGYHTVEWNAKDMSSGIYLYKLTTQDKTFIKKMIILH